MDLIELLGPLGFFTAVVLIVYFSIQAGIKQKKLEHEERMLALEKGVEIPMKTPKAKQKNPYVWPFILIAIGLAFALKGALDGDFDLGFSLVPLLMGGGLLFAHHLYTKNKYKSEPGTPEDK